MSRRRSKGIETRQRLLEWGSDRGSGERMSYQLLHLEEYKDITPVHPMGGKDGKKDVFFKKNENTWISACYFPNGQQNFTAIKKKLKDDLQSVKSNGATGIAFITNQYIRQGQQKLLQNLAHRMNAEIEIYSLDRVSAILDTPLGCGIRLDFLDIEMSKEEQLSFFEYCRKQQEEANKKLLELCDKLLNTSNIENPLNLVDGIKEFKYELNKLTHYDSSSLGMYLSSSPISKLKVPLFELEQFCFLLEKIVGSEYMAYSRPIDRLSVPLEQLQEYEATLDRIIEKKKLLAINTRPPGKELLKQWDAGSIEL